MGDQPQAIEKLTAGLEYGLPHQVLLGVTGSGKTFTIANVIEKVQKPTLVISHNKTLAAQLFQEFREFFPKNEVHYFVSYYDYYQPEAYIPQRDLYIEKEADINKEIEKLRHSATQALITRQDVIVVASVSCIYGLGRPEDYMKESLQIAVGDQLSAFSHPLSATSYQTKNYHNADSSNRRHSEFISESNGGTSQEIPKQVRDDGKTRDAILEGLVRLLYHRNDWDFKRGCFRVRGDTVEVFPPYGERVLRLEFLGEDLEKIKWIEPASGNTLEDLEEVTLFPAKHFITPKARLKQAIGQIEKELEEQIAKLKGQNKELEAHRLKQRTEYDLELMSELGFCSGIENYSRHLTNRKAGEPPYTLLDYFEQGIGGEGKELGFRTSGLGSFSSQSPALEPNSVEFAAKNYLCIIDESHMTVPQIRGMYRGDAARKNTLIDFGFRLPSARDNRPLRFEEFLERVPQIIYTSATPGTWEIEKAQRAVIRNSQFAIRRHFEFTSESNNSNNRHTNQTLKQVQSNRPLLHGGVVEQLIRPTGLLDPEIEIRPTKGQIKDLILEIIKRKQCGERVLVTTLTKRMAEDLATYLSDSDRVHGFIQSLALNKIDFKGIRTQYLHSEIKTLERSDILADLRRGKYDVVVGINLLREGLDLPEVSLVAILDADKEGFLRSETSLIQTMGRAARHVHGQVILYADKVTDSMERAIAEVNRRRQIQKEYNSQHGIKPQTIQKPVRDRVIKKGEEKSKGSRKSKKFKWRLLPPNELEDQIWKWEREMQKAAEVLDFEHAVELRDLIREAQKCL